MAAGRQQVGVRRQQRREQRARAAEPEPERREQHRGRGERRPQRAHRGGRHARLGGEGTPQEPRGVGDGERRPGDQRHQHEGARPGRHARGLAVGQVEQRGEQGLLADEAQQRRQPGHRGAGERRRHRHRGELPSDAGELVHVAGARQGVDDADDEEQRGLEQRVRQEHRGAGERGRPAADREHHHQEPELADRAVGEQQLDVDLAQRPPAADEHRQGAEGEQREVPAGDARERRCEQRHQVQAGLHHRRGVQVGAHGGRGGHRAGEPEVQRHLGRLAQGADQDQQHGDGGGGAGRRVGHDGADPVGAGLLSQHQHPDEHHQPAEGGDHQGLHRGQPARPLGRVEPDEQEREDRRQLPEHEQHQQVVGQDQSEHRADEGGEAAGEPDQTRGWSR